MIRGFVLWWCALLASACDHDCPPRPAYCEDEAYDLHQNAYAYCHRDAVGTIQGGRWLLCTCRRDENGTVGR